MKENFILMLEDDPDDRLITEATLGDLGYHVPVHFVNSSTQLFSFLHTSGKPHLILIDYNSVPVNAVEILKQLKRDARYKKIPVVVLSDSALSDYVSECYENGASSFIKKPTTLESTKDKIGSFFQYWFRTVEV